MLGRFATFFALGAALVVAPAHAAPGRRAGPIGRTATPAAAPEVANAPAVKYGRLDRAACEAELVKRSIPFSRVAEARGVLAPVRLAGPIHGVTYRTEYPPAQRATVPYEIFDCRLVLALDDFSQILAKHDVVEVIHYSAYRPPPASWPANKVASRHPGGLAVDAGRFVRKDKSVLHVEHDFNGKIGTQTCGPSTGPNPVTPNATELRKIACEAADAKLFNVELTPDFNWEHRNHFHLEVTAGVGWFIVH